MKNKSSSRTTPVGGKSTFQGNFSHAKAQSGFLRVSMTRSNEVERRWGPERESEWIGHSRRVWKEHYAMIMDEDFDAASGWSTESVDTGNSSKPSAKSSALADKNKSKLTKDVK